MGEPPGLLARYRELRETPDRRPEQRTTWNVRDSDVTLILLAAPGIVLFALAINFAAFDLLMSLDPHWFSTIFGVYTFAGFFLSGLAATTLVILALKKQGRLFRIHLFHEY